MIDNYYIYNRIRDLSKTGTSGYQSLDQYNRDSIQVCNHVSEMLATNYEKNGAIVDALALLIKSATSDVVSDGSGIVALPNDFLHLDSMGLVLNAKYCGFQKINRNEVDMIMSSSVRKFDPAKNHVGYYREDGEIKALPPQVFTITAFRYIRKPVNPVLALTNVSTGNDDYQTLDPDNTTDWEFGSSVADLIVYLMLEKLGVQMKEELLLEYSKLGIDRATINPATP